MLQLENKLEGGPFFIPMEKVLTLRMLGTISSKTVLEVKFHSLMISTSLEEDTQRREILQSQKFQFQAC